MRNVTDARFLSRHVTDDVTDDLEKNLGKTVFVTVSRLNTPRRGVPLRCSRFDGFDFQGLPHQPSLPGILIKDCELLTHYHFHFLSLPCISKAS